MASIEDLDLLVDIDPLELRDHAIRYHHALEEIGRLLEGCKVRPDLTDETTFRLVAAIQTAAKALDPEWNG